MTRSNAFLTVACVALLASGWVGCAGGPALEGVEGWFGGAGASGESRVVAGLKQALEVGTERTVSRTSRSGGFATDPAIRIGLPESLDTMAKGLRAIGLAAKIDELEFAMNHAAEQASAEATEVFVQGIRQLTIADARSILAGGDTAATEFFERTTREPLALRFEPIVAERMRGIGLVERYDALVDRYVALPFTKPPVLDFESYVTNEALDGLFHVLGNEERRIREDPAARSTALLREVFR